jgi:thiamine biosynthesis protein ThiS
MKIILNNRVEEINADSISVGELLRFKNYTFRMLVTKINSKLVKKEDRDITFISDGDVVIVMHMISGG